MIATTLDQIRDRIRNTHPRTRKAQLNTLVGLFIKGGGMLISLLLVPLTIDYLSKDTYGTWLTISSIATMIALFDIGIGNGLRNKLSEAISTQNLALGRAYISTAYVIFGGLQLLFISIFILGFSFIPWQNVLNTHIESSQLQIVVLMTAIAIALKLVLDILSYVLFALQESGLASLINFLFNVLILIGTYLLTQFTKGNLIYLALVTTVSPLLVLSVSSLVLYKKKLRKFKPDFKSADIKYAKSLLSLGYKFFVIQIAVIVLFYTDNVIITQLFGPSKVTIYNVAFRYFNAATTIFAIIVTPYWSAFTEAFVKNDVGWMKRTYKYLQKIWMLFTVLIILMVVLAETVYSVWVGDRVDIPFSLNVVLGLNVSVICYNTANVSIINGLGKVKVQLICSIFAALINIPLAIYLGKELGLESSGVVLATCLSLLPATVTSTIQANKLINNNAQGVWAQ